MKTIILMYHSVINGGKNGNGFYGLPITKFREQMEYLRKVTTSPGHQVIPRLRSPHFARDFAGQTTSLNGGNNIVITFDDGDVTNYTYAYPVLRNLGFKAYFFIIASKVGTPGYMNWQEIRELKNAGMIIGSHGMTHRILVGLSDGELEQELIYSKEILEKSLNTPIRSFSIPRGFHNEKIIQKAREVGYEEIFTSDLGINTGENFDLFRLQRIPVRNSLSIKRFRRILDGNVMVREKVGNGLKKTSQNLLGLKNYERLVLKLYK